MFGEDLAFSYLCTRLAAGGIFLVLFIFFLPSSSPHSPPSVASRSRDLGEARRLVGGLPASLGGVGVPNFVAVRLSWWKLGADGGPGASRKLTRRVRLETSVVLLCKCKLKPRCLGFIFAPSAIRLVKQSAYPVEMVVMMWNINFASSLDSVCVRSGQTFDLGRF